MAKVGKQGKDASIKQFSIQLLLIFFHYTHNYYGKGCLYG